jgi:hypothetical protein
VSAREVAAAAAARTRCVGGEGSCGGGGGGRGSPATTRPRRPRWSSGAPAVTWGIRARHPSSQNGGEIGMDGGPVTGGANRNRYDRSRPRRRCKCAQQRAAVIMLAKLTEERGALDRLASGTGMAGCRRRASHSQVPHPLGPLLTQSTLRTVAAAWFPPSYLPALGVRHLMGQLTRPCPRVSCLCRVVQAAASSCKYLQPSKWADYAKNGHE